MALLRQQPAPEQEPDPQDPAQAGEPAPDEAPPQGGPQDAQKAVSEIAGSGPDDLPMEQPAPQDQKQYQAIISAAGHLIYDQQHMQDLVQAMKQGDPIAAAATVTVQLVTEIDKTVHIGDNVLMPAALEILAMVLDVASKAGLVNIDKEKYLSAMHAVMGMIAEQFGAGGGDQSQQSQQSQPTQGAPPPDPSQMSQQSQPPQGAPNGPAQQ